MAVAALVLLVAAGALAALDPPHELLFVAAGFLAYVACGARAIALWKLDDRVFARPRS
jgi:hypothetical protein